MTPSSSPHAARSTATIFVDPPSIKPPLWTSPLRAAWPFAAVVIFAGLLHLVIVPHMGGYESSLLIDCGIAIIMAVSLTAVNGFTGQFSIGHAGFMSLGGYFAAAIVYYGTYHLFGDFSFQGGLLSSGADQTVNATITAGDLLFVGACIAGAVLAAICGWIVGLPSLRLRGDYLAIVTLGFGEIVRVIIQGTGDQLDTNSDPSVTDVSFFRALPHLGGALGFSGQPVYSTSFWVWLAAGITLVATLRLKYSSYGRSLISIREDDVAAQAVGVNITRLKVRAFVYAAFFAGLGGGLYAMKVGTINASDFGFQKSFDFVIMVVLGGLGSVSGAAIAAILLTILPELLRDPPSLWPTGLIIVGIVAVLILAFAPKRRGPLVTLFAFAVGWEGLVRGVKVLHWFGPHLLGAGHSDSAKALGNFMVGFSLSDYRMVIYSLTLIIMMIVRPKGLFGIGEIWDFLPVRWQWWNRPARAEEGK
jgi:branched-chain amino acid transport system permease protein